MRSWKDISLYKFQQIEAINANPGMSDFDKTLYSVCAVFDLTEFDLDHKKVKKAAVLIKKVERIFRTPPKSKVLNRVGKYLINYDISKITFGQFIELYFFLAKN